MPPVKETKLSELKTLSIQNQFFEGLPQSTRRSRRKGLKITKEGLAGQKLERMKRLRKLIGDRILEEEVKNDGSRQSKQRSMIKSVRNSTNEGSFKNPGQLTPSKKSSSGNNSKSMLNSSVSSQGQPQAN